MQIARSAAFYRALKPDGVLGIEDHRGHRDTPQDPRAADGYVRQDYAIALAEKAGFTFVGSSEINAARGCLHCGGQRFDRGRDVHC
jgi:predicted methyltransferase